MPKNPYGIPTVDELMGTKKQRKRKKKIKTTIRQHIPIEWKTKILNTQRKKCAGKECVKLSGRKAPIDIYSNFDHIKPLAMKGKHQISNIQGLCLTCHAKKTRADRYKISQWKKKQKNKKPTRKKKKRKSSNPYGDLIPKITIPKPKW